MEPTPPEAPTLRLPIWSPMQGNSLLPYRMGQQLGNYRLIRLLAEGGFAEVYLGEHIHLNTLAAIKVLHARLDRGDLEQFRREARIVARLRHPHIVSIHDFNVEERTGTPFLVMDYAPNGNLRQRHPKGSRLSPATILPYLKQIADALQYAHDERLIHRDIKPENMLIGDRDKILLSDFGIAIVISAHSQTAREVVGTISYMAPEQLQGKPCLASDQYSLGVVVYEWLCGEYPFHGSLGEVAAQHMNTPPPSLCERIPDLSPLLEAVILKTLAKDPGQRHATLLDFVYAFESATHPQALQLYTPLEDSDRASDSQDSNPHQSPTIQATVPAISISTPHPAPSVLPQIASVHRERKRYISRRSVVFGLAGLASLGLAGGSITWLANTHRLTQSALSPTPKPSPTPTAIPVGTTYHTYRGHHDVVRGVSCSFDGRYIASASADKTVQVWDVATGGVSASTYSGHTDAVNTVAWSFDGKLIASGSADKTVQVWSPSSGGTPFTYSGQAGVVNAVAWSLDSTRIASAGGDKTVQVWNASDGSSPYTYASHADAVFAVAWSPPSIGTLIASASADKTVQIWNASNGSNPYTYSGHSGAVLCVAWSPDGTLIASGSADKTVRVWKASSGQLVYIYGGHADAVYAVAWSFDGTRIASASADKTVQIWGASNGSSPFTYTGHTAPVHALAWLPTDVSIIISGSEDTTVQIWQAT